MPIQKTLTLTTLIVLLSPAFADDEPSPLVFCKDWSIIAREIMTARQNDVPMSETLSKAISRYQDWADKYDREMDAQTAEELAAPLVMGAYGEIIEATDRFQQQAITAFENRVFQECYQRRMSDE